mgnify:FL=1
MYATELIDKDVKTELMLKKKDIDIEEYKQFKTEDGATKVTYINE